jgi:hypothetical protein
VGRGGKFAEVRVYGGGSDRAGVLLDLRVQTKLPWFELPFL